MNNETIVQCVVPHATTIKVKRMGILVFLTKSGKKIIVDFNPYEQGVDI